MNNKQNLSGLFGMPPAFICNVKDAMASKRKRYSAKMHSVKRAHKRYGIRLNATDLYHIAKKIRNGNYNLIGKSGPHRIVCKVQYREKTFKLVFDMNLGLPVTFLPRCGD